MNYSMTTSLSEAREYLKGASLCAFDFETAPDDAYRDTPFAALDPAKSRICTISVSTKVGTALMIPVAHKKGTNMKKSDADTFLRELLTNRTSVKIAHNLAFESMFAYKNDIVIRAPVYDTICAAQLTLKGNYQYRSLSDSGLKTLADTLLGEPLPSFEAVTQGRHFDELDPTDPETIRYSCADSDFALRLYHLFNDWFDRNQPKHRRLVEQIESPTAVYVGMMRYNGVPVDVEAMNTAKNRTDQEIEHLKEQITFLIGDVKIGSNCSTAAFKKYLFETLGLPVVKQTDKLQPSVDDEAMLLLKDYCNEHKPEISGLFDLVMKYRNLQKLRSTYLDGYLKEVNDATGRIHPQLMQLATATGRFACRKPNVQNIPQKGQDPVGIRNFIVAPEGWVLLEADYSQAEIRLCAYLSQEPNLLEAYREGKDVHAITTMALYGIPLEEAMNHSRPDYKHRRTVAKSTMFGIMYGIGGAGLSRNLFTNAGITLSKEQCNDYIQSILRGYPRMAAWQQEMKALAAKCQYIETAMGRRRYLPGIRSRNSWERSSAERMAINTPVQGLCADCLKHAMTLLLEELSDKPYIRPILTVHDSLVFLVREDKVKEASTLIERCMETPPDLPEFPPLVAEVSVGRRYGEMD